MLRWNIHNTTFMNKTPVCVKSYFLWVSELAMLTRSPPQGLINVDICLHAIIIPAALSSCSMELINEWLWRQEYWLPPGISWKDLEQMEGSPFPRDLLISLPLAVGFIVLRKIFERWSLQSRCSSWLLLMSTPLLHSHPLFNTVAFSWDWGCTSHLHVLIQHVNRWGKKLRKWVFIAAVSNNANVSLWYEH